MISRFLFLTLLISNQVAFSADPALSPARSVASESVGPARSVASESVGAPLANEKLALRAVGQVGDTVISTREVVLAGVIEEWLYALQDRPNAVLSRREKESWFLDTGSPKFNGQLSRVLIDVMINLEAENFNVAAVSPAELQRLSTRFMIDMAGLEAWRRWTPTAAEAQLLLRRKLRAKAFLDFKSEGSRDMISDEEAKRYFENNKGKFGNLSFEQASNSIKDVLTREKIEARLRDWFEGLKKKYKVRILSPPEMDAKAGP